MLKNKGFTLIEIMIVISIIGLLAVLILVAVQNSRDKAADTKTVSSMDDVKTAVEMYYSSKGSFPANINDADLQEYFNSEIPENIEVLSNGSCYVVRTQLIRAGSELLNKESEVDGTACGVGGFNCEDADRYYCLIGGE